MKFSVGTFHTIQLDYICKANQRLFANLQLHLRMQHLLEIALNNAILIAFLRDMHLLSDESRYY